MESEVRVGQRDRMPAKYDPGLEKRRRSGASLGDNRGKELPLERME